MALPQGLSLDAMDNAWAALIDPVLKLPWNDGAQLLENIKLSPGTNAINHKLSKKLRGYIVVMKSASSDIYDTQSTNQMPQLTLNLVSSAACTVSLVVF